MHFSQSLSDLYIPDSLSEDLALPRTTHLGIGAHQDDLEFMALHGILECFHRDDNWFGAVTCTDGGGSSRAGFYVNYTDEQMKAVRKNEQKTAACIGQYSFVAQLGHPSSNCKDSLRREALVDDLFAVLMATRPTVVYSHNPFDKHATHIGVFLAALEAICRMPDEDRPACFFGCEVWRGLDWLPDDMKIVNDVSSHANLAAALNGVFDSQISGGKRYDLAVDGRRFANATFFESHACDSAEQVDFAIDLTPLIQNDGPDLGTFVEGILQQFNSTIKQGITV